MTAIRSGWSIRRSWNICTVIGPLWGWLIPMAVGRGGTAETIRSAHHAP